MAINLATAYVEMLYYDRIDVSEEIDINISNKSKECMICHYWYFFDRGYENMSQKYATVVMMYQYFSIRKYCIIWNTSKRDAFNKLNNSKLDNKGSL